MCGQDTQKGFQEKKEPKRIDQQQKVAPYLGGYLMRFSNHQKRKRKKTNIPIDLFTSFPEAIQIYLSNQSDIF